MKVSIMQPTYLPWVGYFSMIEKVDLFVFLDDVQLDKRSWQQRNKILLNSKETYLTVPINTKKKFSQNINCVEIDNSQKWSENHLKKIYYAYCKSLYFKEIYPKIEKIHKKNHIKLLDLNISFINEICDFLNIKTKKILSSEINIKEKKDKKLLKICKQLGASEYISPIGSKSYINEGKIFIDSNIKFSFFNYKNYSYNQFNSKKFIPNLSIIDLLFNCGQDSKKYF